MTYCISAGILSKAESFLHTPISLWPIRVTCSPSHRKHTFSTSAKQSGFWVFLGGTYRFFFSFVISCMLVSESHSGNTKLVKPKDIRSQYSRIISDPRTPYLSYPSEPVFMLKSDCNTEFNGSSEHIAFRWCLFGGLSQAADCILGTLSLKNVPEKASTEFPIPLSCFPERFQESASDFTGVINHIFTFMRLVFNRTRVFKVCLPDVLCYRNIEMAAVHASG